MIFIPRTEHRMKSYSIFLPSIILLAWITTTVTAQQSSPKLVESKLKMAVKISESFKNNNIELSEELNVRLMINNQKINHSLFLVEQKQWQEADTIVSEAIKEFIFIGTQSKKNVQLPCPNKIIKLKRTATLLINIFETSGNDSTTEINAEAKLRDQLKALQENKIDHERSCDYFQQVINDGIKTIENRYQNNTVVVKLDLSTALKRYTYDKKRYNTYELLLQEKLKLSSLRSQARNRISILINEASVLRQSALNNYEIKDFAKAEILQANANSKLVRALQVSGLYLSE